MKAGGGLGRIKQVRSQEMEQPSGRLNLYLTLTDVEESTLGSF